MRRRPIARASFSGLVFEFHPQPSTETAEPATPVNRDRYSLVGLRPETYRKTTKSGGKGQLHVICCGMNRLPLWPRIETSHGRVAIPNDTNALIVLAFISEALRQDFSTALLRLS